MKVLREVVRDFFHGMIHKISAGITPFAVFLIQLTVRFAARRPAAFRTSDKTAASERRVKY